MKGRRHESSLFFLQEIIIVYSLWWERTHVMDLVARKKTNSPKWKQTQPNSSWSALGSSLLYFKTLNDWQLVSLIMPPVPETTRSVNWDFTVSTALLYYFFFSFPKNEYYFLHILFATSELSVIHPFLCRGCLLIDVYPATTDSDIKGHFIYTRLFFMNVCW